MIPQNKLPFAAHRILDCINQMFANYFWQTAIKQRLPAIKDLKIAYIALENSTVVSSLISIRAFDDFANNRRHKNDDLIASDFPAWSFNQACIDSHERTRINKLILHMTHMELDTGDQKHLYRNYLETLLPTAILFCDHVLTTFATDNPLCEFADSTNIVCNKVWDQYIKNLKI